jgi:hypothetical protein
LQWQGLESADENHARVVSIADDVVVPDVRGSCGTVQVEVGGAPWLTGMRVRLVLGGQGVDDDYFGQPGFFGDFSLDGLAEGSAGVGGPGVSVAGRPVVRPRGMPVSAAAS